MNQLARRRNPLVAPALLAIPLLLAGCGAAADASAGSQTTSGMSMAPGAATPPDTALMVCGDDISSKVVQVLKLDRPPLTDSAWAAPLYTCTYHLPMGEMVLSVQVAADAAAAGDLFDADRTRRSPAQDLLGLGERAFGTTAGVAVVVKDDQMLTVDTTALPEV